MKIPTKRATGSAHGKIILIGEHSVVHHQPAIAIPFTSATVDVFIDPIIGDVLIDSLYYKGKMKEAPASLNNLKETLHGVTLYLGVQAKDMQITINSKIPAERGMGSSAAVATAFVRALFDYFDRELSHGLLNQFVGVAEKIAHGNPSGIDASVVRSDDAVYFIRNQKTEHFDSHLPAYLVIADTGQEGETIHAVADVGKLVANEQTDGRKWIEELGRLTIEARKKIEEVKVNELGQILTQAQVLLKNLTVSNDALDQLVASAIEHGALGAKLTGGGRGGCMIALVETFEQAETLADKLIEAKAIKTWIHPLGVDNNG